MITQDDALTTLDYLERVLTLTSGRFTPLPEEGRLLDEARVFASAVRDSEQEDEEHDDYEEEEDDELEEEDDDDWDEDDDEEDDEDDELEEPAELFG